MAGMTSYVTPHISLLCGLVLLIVSAYTSRQWLDAVLRFAVLAVCCTFLLDFNRGMHYDEMSITHYLWVVIMANILCLLPFALWSASLGAALPFMNHAAAPGRIARALLSRRERHRAMLLRSVCFTPLAAALLLMLRYGAEASLREGGAYAAAIYAAAAAVTLLPEACRLLRRSWRA